MGATSAGPLPANKIEINKLDVYQTMKHSLLVLLFSFVSITAFAHLGTVVGTVYDQTTNLPLRGVTVQLTGLNRATVTILSGTQTSHSSSAIRSTATKSGSVNGGICSATTAVTVPKPVLAKPASLPPSERSIGTLGLIIKPFPRLLINVAAWYLWLAQEFVYVGNAGVVEPGGHRNPVAG